MAQAEAPPDAAPAAKKAARPGRSRAAAAEAPAAAPTEVPAAAKRRRAAAVPKASAASTDSSAEPAPTPVELPMPAAEPPAPARRRASRRATPVTEEVVAETAAEAVVAVPPAPTPAPLEAEAATPAARRRRPKAAAEPTVTTAAAPVPEPAPEPAPAPDASPAPKRRRRATPAAETPPVAEIAAVEASEPPAPPPDDAVAAPAKPTRSRSRRKAVAEPAAALAAVEPSVADALVEAVDGADDEVAKAPADAPTAKPSRRRRKLADAVPVEVESDVEAVATERPLEVVVDKTTEVPVDGPVGRPIEPPAEAAAPRSSRRRRHKSAAAVRPDEPADVAPESETVEAAEPAAEPVDEGRPELAAEPVAPPPLPPLPAWPLADLERFVTEAVDPAAPFGPHRVTDRRSAAVHAVHLRGLAVGDNDCDCADFALSDDAACPHLHSLLAAQVAHGSLVHAALLAGTAPAHSELQLRYGVERQVVWRPGSACPAELSRLAARLLDEQGRLLPGDAAVAQRLQRRAAELGHRLDVSDAVWQHLGELHDAQRRLLTLEAAYPTGPADITLRHGLLRHPLAAHQVEAALLAASAGRCVLADEAGLGKIAQALAALALLRRHFGAERLLIAVPPELRRRWHRAVARWGNVPVRHGLEDLADASAQAPGPLLRIVGLDELLQKIDRVAAWAPDALVLDEGALDEAPWLGRSGAQLARLDLAATLVITRRRLDNRPEALETLVRWLDPQRSGATRRLLAQHRRDGADAGWTDLANIGQTLLPLLIGRQRPAGTAAGAELALPHAAGDDVHTLALSPEQAARHQLGRVQATRLVERWERVGDLSSREQRELLGAVQAMRRSCVAQADGAGHGVDPKTAALLALIDELGAHDPAPRLVVCSQWASALQPLAQALAARGVEALGFDAVLDDATLADRAARFASEPACRVALVADAVLPRLHLDHADAGLVHLDRPWQPGRMTERLHCVLPMNGHAEAQAAAAATVPVLHLIAESSLEEALLDQQTSLAAPGSEPDAAEVARLLDHPASGAFLSGAALGRLVQQLREVLQAI